MEVVLSKRASRDVAALSEADRAVVVAALRALSFDSAASDVKKLQGVAKTYRLRVGRWRVIYERDATARRIDVLRVVDRKDAYR